MVIPQNKSTASQKNFLQFGWSKNFLDLTVISLNMRNDFNSYFTWNYQSDDEMHQYNSFTRTCIQQKFYTVKRIFPDKWKNLNGFIMNVSTSTLYYDQIV